MFRATLFDYNGVLVDDEHVHLEAYRDVLRPMGIELSERDYWDKYLGYDDAGAFRAILTDRGMPPGDERVSALVEAKRPHYLARAAERLRGFPGAAEVVRRRRAAGPVAIVSGALRDEIELGLRVLGVADSVSGIVAAEDTTRSKPDPEGYVLGVALLAREVGRAVAERALVIEDSISGVEAAKGAGLACVAVGHSYPESALASAGADLVVPALGGVTEAALAELYRRLYGP